MDCIKNIYLRMEFKIRIYKSVVRSILTSAAETRADTNKTIQIPETTEMKENIKKDCQKIKVGQSER